MPVLVLSPPLLLAGVLGPCLSCLCFVAAVLAVVYLKLGQSQKPGNHAELELPWEEPTKEGVDADGHLQEDEHEDNPLAEFDVEAMGDDGDVVDT